MEPPWSREDQTRSRTIQPLNRKQAIMFRHGEQIARAPSSNAQSHGRAERPNSPRKGLRRANGPAPESDPRAPAKFRRTAGTLTVMFVLMRGMPARVPINTIPGT